MAKKPRTPEWDKKPCGCVKTELSIGKVLIRCARHREKPYGGKRVRCYWDDGMVRREP